ncbi:flagellar protein FlgJ [Mariprofundus ferrinatatus]|jgi:flagellar protein FlgJ|uniref:Flagellar protein FlgJ n=1 Tax=Mariprofundus ferrinatatus TaxID=1921087 RepID=A0A2K8L6K1_9PROT|nr:rod-binding protein [Mariprofundus ferrinatatus]ATX82948.1 flagellar protein FlgJ [Mariprofundus ferrinatatus]
MSDMTLSSARLAMAQNALQEHPQVGSAKKAGQPAGHEKDPALWEVSLKFEAMLMQQMMSAMRKTVPQDGVLSAGFANDIYTSMFDQAITETSSKSGSMGIAENIYRQMSSNQTNANPTSADRDTGNMPARPEE